MYPGEFKPLAMLWSNILMSRSLFCLNSHKGTHIQQHKGTVIYILVQTVSCYSTNWQLAWNKEKCQKRQTSWASTHLQVAKYIFFFNLLLKYLWENAFMLIFKHRHNMFWWKTSNANINVKLHRIPLRSQQQIKWIKSHFDLGLEKGAVINVMVRAVIAPVEI